MLRILIIFTGLNSKTVESIIDQSLMHTQPFDFTFHCFQLFLNIIQLILTTYVICSFVIFVLTCLNLSLQLFTLIIKVFDMSDEHPQLISNHLFIQSYFTQFCNGLVVLFINSNFMFPDELKVIF